MAAAAAAFFTLCGMFFTGYPLDVFSVQERRYTTCFGICKMAVVILRYGCATFSMMEGV